MKHIIIFILSILLFSCNRHMQTASAPVTINGNTILLGKISSNQLEQAPFGEWYNKEYNAYRPDEKVSDSLQQLIKPYRFEIFLGTWCGDSKREVPRLMKLLQSLHVNPTAITIIAVGNNDTLYKQSPGHEEKGKNVYRVPHLTIMRNGKEAGVITETPVITWEKDLLAILRGQSYTATHAGLLKAGKLIESRMKINAAVKPEDVLGDMRALALHSGQLLNSYGYVKLYSNEPDAAYLAFRLNTLLFPDAWYTYNALATYYRMRKDETQEKLWLQQLLQKKPDEENAKKRLAILQ
ncbi:MAG: hypothetical protein WCF67_10075 [Chitinophagaceae bacterium]